MKYLLSQDELDELKAGTTKTEDRVDNLLELLKNAQYLEIQNDPQQYGVEILKIAVLTHKIPDEYLNFIKNTRLVR